MCVPAYGIIPARGRVVGACGWRMLLCRAQTSSNEFSLPKAKSAKRKKEGVKSAKGDVDDDEEKLNNSFHIYSEQTASLLGERDDREERVHSDSQKLGLRPHTWLDYR